ncbi:restriction endonuclease subunit S [Campylobacter upsaliensis]|uniref:restriction endonuclease subunit S n=1 Tax=Campylobacter upsaliensis TaxID=28080 RepID=UPI0022EA27A0|nr:restriction endonuclease subunit S [Campylobacter upsaliensis]
MKKHTQSPYESSKVSYKPSGIEWLGEIPQSWEIRRLKHLTILFTGESIKDADKDKYSIVENAIPYIATKDIGLDSNDVNYNNGMFIQNDDTGFKRAYKNSTLLCLEGANAGKKIAFLNQEVCFVNKLCCISNKSKELDSKALFYFFQGSFFKNTFFSNISGLIGGVTTTQLGNFKIPLPPLQEQKEIAEFLDKKCEKIQNYINKKQKLITLLQEKKQALINEAVCGRVACHTERSEVSTTAYKPSGIEYLGLIPHHWEVRRVATLGKFFKGSNISKNDLQDSGVSVVLYGDIYTKYEIKTKQFQSKIAENFAKDKTQILCGDLLFSGSGETKEDIGKCICYLGNEKAYVGGDVIVLRQMGQDSLFLSYVLNSDYIKYQKAVISKGEIIIHIYASNLRDLKIPLPPLQEQKEIAAFLDSKVAQINSAIEKTKKQIELVKEYKNTLINEAVCGRINLERK